MVVSETEVEIARGLSKSSFDAACGDICFFTFGQRLTRPNKYASIYAKVSTARRVDMKETIEAALPITAAAESVEATSELYGGVSGVVANPWYM